MALQHAQQLQSIMLTHHGFEQHALSGLVHDGEGLCTLSPAGVRHERQFPVLGCQDQWMNASSFQYFGYIAAANSWWLGAPRLLAQEDAHTARVLLAVRTYRRSRARAEEPSPEATRVTMLLQFAAG